MRVSDDQTGGGMTLGIAPEQAVRDFVVETECEHMDASRIERLLDRMAPGARYHVRAWQEPFVGHDAIRGELLRQAPLFSHGSYETLSVASVGQTVFTERVDSVIVEGKRASFHLVDVFEVDADGKIVSWRTYSDSAENAVKVAPSEPPTH
jgi:limonene-1,2-epoxide hydrolase